MTPAIYIIVLIALFVSGGVAGVVWYLRRRLVREWSFAPPAVVVGILAALACEIGFMVGAVLLAIVGVPVGEGEPHVRRGGLLLAIVAGVIYLEIGAPVGAILRGNPFRKLDREAGSWGTVKYWFRKSSRHGFRMGVFFASFLPVLAGLRLLAPGVPGVLRPVGAFVWLAAVIWALRGRSLFPAQQPLVAVVAAGVSLYSAAAAGDPFVQAFSLLVLAISAFAALLNLPQLLPLPTWASAGYLLAVLALLNSSRGAGVVLVLLTGVAALLAKLSRNRDDRKPPSKASPGPLRKRPPEGGGRPRIVEGEKL